MNVLLVLLLGDEVGLLVREAAADGTGLLVAEVEGEVCMISIAFGVRLYMRPDPMLIVEPQSGIVSTFVLD